MKMTQYCYTDYYRIILSKLFKSSYVATYTLTLAWEYRTTYWLPKHTHTHHTCWLSLAILLYFSNLYYLQLFTNENKIFKLIKSKKNCLKQCLSDSETFWLPLILPLTWSYWIYSDILILSPFGLCSHLLYDIMSIHDKMFFVHLWYTTIHQILFLDIFVSCGLLLFLTAVYINFGG